MGLFAVNSATNIYKIAKKAINGLERPKYLCRKKKDENIKIEKSKKEKVKKVVQPKSKILVQEHLTLSNVVQKKAKKSVKVVALTKT